MTKTDASRSTCRVTLGISFQTRRDLFRTIKSRPKDGEFLSKRGGEGLTKDVEIGRKE